MRSEVLLHQRLRLGPVDVTGDRQGGVVGNVVGAEEPLDVLERRGAEIGHRADHLVKVGVVRRVERFEQDPGGEPGGAVLGALPALVLDDVALVVERLLEPLAVEEEPHALALQPERQLELIRRDDLVVVGSVMGRRSVHVGRPGLLQELEVLVLGDVLRPLEHDVLEQVGEAGLSRLSRRASRPCTRRRRRPPACGGPREGSPRARSAARTSRTGSAGDRRSPASSGPPGQGEERGSGAIRGPTASPTRWKGA